MYMLLCFSSTICVDWADEDDGLNYMKEAIVVSPSVDVLKRHAVTHLSAVYGMCHADMVWDTLETSQGQDSHPCLITDTGIDDVLYRVSYGIRSILYIEGDTPC